MRLQSNAIESPLIATSGASGFGTLTEAALIRMWGNEDQAAPARAASVRGGEVIQTTRVRTLPGL
jgi:hypothetical protein